MSGILLIIVTLLYCGVAVSYLYEGDRNLAIVFMGYALANIGFILAGAK